MSDEPILREDHEGIVLLTLAHGKVNALDAELARALDARLEEAEATDVRAVVLTGRGGSFSAGVDLFRLLDGGDEYLDTFLAHLRRAFARLFTFPKPLVAALNGHAIAGGAIVAAGADRRIAMRGRGRAGVPELKVGVPFPAMAFEMLRVAVSDRHFSELLYRGETYEMEEAVEVGLVDELVDPAAEEDGDPLLDRALTVARELAELPPHAFRLTKWQLRLPALDRLERLGAELDRDVLAQWGSEGARQRIRAYLDATVGKR